MANKSGVTVVASYVSPTDSLRGVVENIVTNLDMVYVRCSSTRCAERDVKGMWAKAKAGEIKGFTGHDAPFEAPSCPALILDTENNELSDCVTSLMRYYGV